MYSNPLSEYGMTDQQYSFAKNNKDLLSELLILYPDNNIEDIASNILKENEIILDKRQLSLFGDKYAEITESIRAKVLNELNNDDTLGEYLGVTEVQVNTMNIEELGDILNKICNK